MLEVRHRQYEHGCQWQGDQETGGSRKSARQPSRDTNDQCGKDNIDDNRPVNTLANTANWEITYDFFE
jgi:hypothetical protein